MVEHWKLSFIARDTITLGEIPFFIGRLLIDSQFWPIVSVWKPFLGKDYLNESDLENDLKGSIEKWFMTILIIYRSIVWPFWKILTLWPDLWPDLLTFPPTMTVGYSPPGCNIYLAFNCRLTASFWSWKVKTIRQCSSLVTSSTSNKTAQNDKWFTKWIIKLWICILNKQ